MPLSRTFMAALIGLALPMAAIGTADAASRARTPARVSTATYKAHQHKPLRHRTAATPARTRHVAQAHRSLSRGS